ncbi:MAG TPA: zf-HC2 domain-containing protein, partial [Acidimicrobiales bacterium]|nr:zf-HC2 domain-containing protein [Acidimicrobiales bacterium]
MRCKSAQAALSARLDSALPPEEERILLDHVAGCPSCQTLQHRLLDLRRRLRVEPLGQVPDVAPRVLAELGRRTGSARRWPVRRIRRPWLRPVAVAFAAGVVAGAAFIGLNPRRPAQVVAADIDAQVLAAQRHVSTLSADITIVERGWHPRVPLRTFEGTLRYQAPESLALQLADRTHYPSAAWRRNDISVVVAEDRWWSSGFPACPVALEPSCEPPAPRQRAVINREPFALDSPSGLDLVVPVASFDIPTAPSTLPSRQVSGRPAIGVETTVAQLAPRLSGLQQAGNWRELFPADPVELWLDQSNLVPLALTVRAG